MYAGIVSTSHASTWLGAHQKIDRLAYKAMCRYKLVHLEPVRARTELSRFPDIKLIQHFEGVNGPDGIKMKSPGRDDLMHFYDPYTAKKDAPIFKIIDQHYKELIVALKSNNEERAAFEASWLAHAIVDGLTPAHHYPYEEEIEALRGEPGHTRTTRVKKMLIKGETRRDSLKKSWQFLGAKGVLSTHLNFEAGVASALIPLRLRSAMPSVLEVEYARQHGLIGTFSITALAIADLKLYERFYKNGWTVNIARDVRGLLLPQMVRTVALAWLLALEDS